jgi:hypothetical protein
MASEAAGVRPRSIGRILLIEVQILHGLERGVNPRCVNSGTIDPLRTCTREFFLLPSEGCDRLSSE